MRERPTPSAPPNHDQGGQHLPPKREENIHTPRLLPQGPRVSNRGPAGTRTQRRRVIAGTVQGKGRWGGEIIAGGLRSANQQSDPRPPRRFLSVGPYSFRRGPSWTGPCGARVRTCLPISPLGGDRLPAAICRRRPNLGAGCWLWLGGRRTEGNAGPPACGAASGAGPGRWGSFLAGSS